MTAVLLHVEAEAAIAEVLSEAFRDYPVMRHVIGDEPDYDARLRRLVGFFVARRLRQGGPGFGVIEGGDVVAAAVLTRPVEPEMPPEVADLRDELWAELGEPARRRYDGYAAATRAFFDERPHHHLNMIGVRDAHRGRGLARPILTAMRELAARDPGSAGVSLTTEVPANVRLYEHFGYTVTAHVQIAPGFESWGMFLPTR